MTFGVSREVQGRYKFSMNRDPRHETLSFFLTNQLVSEGEEAKATNRRIHASKLCSSEMLILDEQLPLSWVQILAACVLSPREQEVV
jgi:hypothetical protein